MHELLNVNFIYENHLTIQVYNESNEIIYQNFSESFELIIDPAITLIEARICKVKFIYILPTVPAYVLNLL
jgi:hypothetical protein